MNTLQNKEWPERIGSGARDVCDWLQFTALGQLFCLAVFFYGLFALIVFTEPGRKIAEYLIELVVMIGCNLFGAPYPY
ncbi:hypothetical protein QQM41_11640 [Acetobacter sp. AC2005]|uniref:hypothetical protein n=1 Tax=Acetobacter sp. AC2005 TaxID=3134142 RepID=UPI000F571846